MRARRTKSKFRVMGSFDMATVQEATVTVERGLDPLLHVRILRRKRQFTLPLSTVASMVVKRIIMAEVAEKKQKRKHKAKRGLL